MEEVEEEEEKKSNFAPRSCTRNRYSPCIIATRRIPGETERKNSSQRDPHVWKIVFPTHVSKGVDADRGRDALLIPHHPVLWCARQPPYGVERGDE